MTLADHGGWPGVLGRLTGGENLEGTVAQAAMSEILAGEASEAQIAAFIVALRMKGETTDELNGLLDAILDAAQPVPVDVDELDPVDTCGTGGDAAGTINVSSVAALVVAGAGAVVCKHGNRAASSQCGSADVFAALGVNIELDGEGVARCLTQAGIGFCFAPAFHPSFRHAGPVRKELGVRTVFNFLGPMANPARVRRQVLGVSDPSMADRMADVLAARGARRVLVVHGHDGLDELTVTGPSSVVELRDRDVRRYDVDPAEFGLSRGSRDDLKGGTAEENAAAAHRILGGDPGPQRDVVVLNAAAGLVAAGVADDLAEGVQAAQTSIDDGKAADALTRLIDVSNT